MNNHELIVFRYDKSDRDKMNEIYVPNISNLVNLTIDEILHLKLQYSKVNTDIFNNYPHSLYNNNMILWNNIDNPSLDLTKLITYYKSLEYRYSKGMVIPTDVYAVSCVLPKNANIYIIGDLHSSLESLRQFICRLKVKNVFKSESLELNPNNYIVFLGDMVDRGPYSIEILLIIAKLQASNKFHNVFVLSGNHEDFQTYKQNGLLTEIIIEIACHMYILTDSGKQTYNKDFPGNNNKYLDIMIPYQYCEKYIDISSVSNITELLQLFENHLTTTNIIHTEKYEKYRELIINIELYLKLLPCVMFLKFEGDDKYFQLCHGGIDPRFNPITVLPSNEPITPPIFYKIDGLNTPIEGDHLVGVNGLLWTDFTKNIIDNDKGYQDNPHRGLVQHAKRYDPIATKKYLDENNLYSIISGHQDRTEIGLLVDVNVILEHGKTYSIYYYEDEDEDEDEESYIKIINTTDKTEYIINVEEADKEGVLLENLVITTDLQDYTVTSEIIDQNTNILCKITVEQEEATIQFDNKIIHSKKTIGNPPIIFRDNGKEPVLCPVESDKTIFTLNPSGDNKDFSALITSSATESRALKYDTFLLLTSTSVEIILDRYGKPIKEAEKKYIMGGGSYISKYDVNKYISLLSELYNELDITNNHKKLKFGESQLSEYKHINKYIKDNYRKKTVNALKNKGVIIIDDNISKRIDRYVNDRIIKKILIYQSVLSD